MGSVDLSPLMSGWPYDPERISVRKILGSDGRIKIQMRVELGLMQLEVAGRPDGARPGGHDTVLEMHLASLRAHQRRNGTTFGFTINSEDCSSLREEAGMFHHRYVCLFVLDEYDGVERDTCHHIGILDLCRQFAADREDQLALETTRPYVLSMHARAAALRTLRDGKPRDALNLVDRGILRIQDHLEQIGQSQHLDDIPEAEILRELRQELLSIIPEPPKRKLRRQLRTAVKEERYEDAARFRDALAREPDASNDPPAAR